MTSPWDMPDFDDHEALHLMRDAKSGLSAIIAIHSTHLGPAGGGTRFWHYADSEAAITNNPSFSGHELQECDGRTCDGRWQGRHPAADAKGMKSPEMISAFARAINSLGGRYVTAQDVGMSAADMVAISQGTRYVSGLPPKDGGAGGDPWSDHGDGRASRRQGGSQARARQGRPCRRPYCNSGSRKRRRRCCAACRSRCTPG